MLFLAGDIGGTKALLQLIYTSPEQVADFSISATSQTIQLATQSYPCANFDSLESIINTFLSQALSAANLSALPLPEASMSFTADLVNIQSACFGLPGPVNGRSVQLTNLPWVVDAQKIEQACAIQSVHFVNDFYAAAKGVQSLTEDDLIVLYSPEEQISDAGNRLVIGAGTGLGVAPLFYDGKNYHPVSSEGGHFDFAPISETQQLLLAWLWQQWSHVSYERVLSGPGLEALYHFFKAVDCPVSYSSKNSTQSTQSLGLNKNRLNAAQHNLLATLATAGNSPLSPLGDKALSAAQISAAADLGDPVAIKALTEFVTIYGAFVGAVALIWHAPQGIYLTGGIAAKILPWMQNPCFKQAFLEKGRMSKVVATMPVFLVIDESLGLKGAMLQNQLLETLS
jgi:glucokinase